MIAVYVWPIWFIVRLMSLNTDGVADYSFETNQRRAIDAKWQAQAKGNRAVRRQLLLWIAAILAAMFWLLHLVGLPLIALFSFFK